ncbi:MAG TPA: response regulator, partial [Burkholderiales bacterium]
MARILIADDHRANRDALASLLEFAGYEVITAANGLEALKTALERRPDLVISDVLMPAMDGYGLARRLRADPATAGTRLMFYTAYFDRPEAKELAEAHGVACVLAKPSDNDAILAAVREALAAHAAPLAAVAPDLDRDRLRMMVDQLLEKTGALEAEQRRVGRLNRTLSMISAVNALIARLPERQTLLEEACRIAVEKGGYGLAEITLREGVKDFGVSRGEGSDAFPEALELPLKVSEQTAGSLRLRARGRPDEEEMRLLQELAEAHGVACVLAKPSDNDAILAAVREALAAHAAPLAAVAP